MSETNSWEFVLEEYQAFCAFGPEYKKYVTGEKNQTDAIKDFLKINPDYSNFKDKLSNLYSEDDFIQHIAKMKHEHRW
jgi:hypothetical protein